MKLNHHFSFTINSIFSINATLTISLVAYFGFFSLSCQEPTEYSIIYSEEEPFGEISKQLKNVLECDSTMKVNLINGVGSLANVDSVAQGKADFTLAENYIPHQDSVKSVLVFYDQILHIFYSAPETPSNFRELVENRKVFMGAVGSGSYRFMKNLFSFFHVDTTTVTIVNDPFEDIDVFAGFNDILRENYLLGLKSYKLFSLGKPGRIGQGSIADAIALKYPKVHPYIIPKETYGNITPEPVLTIATEAVLVANENIDASEINSICKSIYEQRQKFHSISPLIYKSLNEEFDRSRLTFPLHEGARIYFDRDEPSIMERYAELIGVVFSIFIALVSGLLSLNRWVKQRKKDRIDVFYKDLMEIKNKISSITDDKQAKYELETIHASQNKAFTMLIDEKLAADESFRIYTELSREIIDELNRKIETLKTKKT